MEYTINNADICELAHEYTERECQFKGITNIDIDDGNELRYTDEAQAIFDEHYNRITSILGV